MTNRSYPAPNSIASYLNRSAANEWLETKDFRASGVVEAADGKVISVDGENYYRGDILEDAISHTFGAYSDSIQDVNVTNGWYDGDVYVPTADAAIALASLMASEVFEGIEEIRNGEPVTLNYYVSPAGQKTTDKEGYVELFGKLPKPEGFPSELADVVIRALDIASRWGIDLEGAIREKIAYNATRGVRHGDKLV